MGRKQPIRIIIEQATDTRPIMDRAAHAAAFVQDLLSDAIPQWAAEVHAAVAASRRRTPIDQILNQKQDPNEGERKEMEAQIAELQARLKQLESRPTC